MKKILILICVVLCYTCLYAMAIDAGNAAEIADALLGRLSSQAHSQRSLQIVYSSDHQTDLYIFRYDPAGFVILAADDRCVPILAYSADADIPENDLPPAVAWILAEYQNGISLIRKSKTAKPDPTWQAFLSDDLSAFELSRNVSPMITAQWHQGSPYNNACPNSGSGPGGHTPTGCVALSMAQVMRYWEHPTTGVGSNSYTLPGIGYISANFGSSTYNWDNMPDQTYTVNTDIANLIYHCGVAVNTVYAPEGSGAFLLNAVDALEDHFRYHASAEYVSASEYNSTIWEGKLRTELNAGRPILYRGQSTAGAHAWIIDGYQGSNYFHCNWGWGGSYDGYFYLNDLSPDIYYFGQMQEAILGLYPVYQGNLAGVVRSGSTPISGAEVSLSGRMCVSDEDGNYSFSGVNIGTYSLTVSKDGYYQQTLETQITANNTTTLDINLSEPLYPPSGLWATIVEDDVNLNWQNPVPPILTEDIYWGSGDYGGAYGYGSNTSFDVAQRWSQADLNQYYQGYLTQVKIYPCYSDCVYTIKVWSGGSSSNPGAPVYSQVLTNPTLNSWNTITLPEPLAFPESGDLWVGYGIYSQGGLPIGHDTGPAVDNKGNMICIAGNWSSMLYFGAQFDFNWLIKATVSYTGRSEEMLLSHAGCSDRDLCGYKLWRFLEGQESSPEAWQLLTPETVTGYSLTDPDFYAFPAGTYKWAVKAVYTSTAMSEAVLSNPLIQGLMPPLSPVVSISAVSNGVRLSWPAVQTDISGSPVSRVQYKVYAYNVPDFPAIDTYLLGSTRDTFYIHNAGSDKVFYQVRACTNP